MKIFKKFLILLILILPITFSFSKDLPKMNFLVLMSFHPTLPWSKQLISGLDELSKKYNIVYHIEYLDKIRTDNLLTEDEWVSYLKQKYKLVKFDAILLDGEYPTKLFSKIDNKFSNNIPTIHITGSNKNLKNNEYTLSKDRGNKLHLKTIDMMLRHNPKLETIFLVKGQLYDHSLSENSLLQKLKKTNIKVVLLKDYTFDELYRKVKKLPDNSALFYNVILKDKMNNRKSPFKVLENITKNSNIPVYSSLITLIERGIVGGTLLSSKVSIKSMVEASMDYINTKSFKKEYKYYESIVDWNMIKKFNIDESLIDPKTKIINKPKSIFEEFFYEVVIGFIIVTLLVILLAVFISLSYKLRKLNKKLKVESINRLEKEKMLSQQSRLAAMGEMINNIAHQWRQPLNRINSNISVISLVLGKEKIEKFSLLDEKLNNIERQTFYMSNTIEDFLTFFKPNKKKEVFFIKDALNLSLKLIDSRLKKIDIVFEETKDIEYLGYKSEFIQVILAILNNAIDNFESKHIQNPKITIKIEKSKDINISIIDNGGGADEIVLERIFDPYFSTKIGKESSGLGLYISKMIIENSMSGKLNVFSDNKNMEFKITLEKD